ncbi:ABC transporter permease subunit [Streptomyces albipurpureus]|uniref:ABC transporter permease subunit n=1 Tax=Streptomyces albipurpureus TaxID=2897419 RepID=A0ABT0UIN7_9ACTN|nr:ABC transporter permease subunit [Streptomyces sp. CWNU-1]MCM2387864.1 ABC transporter permease subunit [Streptomyces sp. CWNU-1]
MTTPYQHQGAPGAVYSSPIPIRRAHLGDAIASEWTKIRSVRSTIWTLSVMALLLVGIGLAVAAAITTSDANVEDQPILSLGFFGVLLGSLCVMTLGVLTVASEYGTGMIRTTLTACPTRGRVLTAKAIVFFALVFTVTLALTLFVGVAQVAIIDQGSPTTQEWLRSTLGVSLYLALLGLLSLAVGSMIRHSAGAITIMIGLVLLPLVMAMFMFTESLSWLQDALLEYSIPSQLGVLYDNSVTQSGPMGWEPLWIMLGIAAVALGAAYTMLNSRDV